MPCLCRSRLGRKLRSTKNEDALLSLLESRTESSRLSCQLKMNAARDGVVVRTLALEADA